MRMVPTPSIRTRAGLGRVWPSLFGAESWGLLCTVPRRRFYVIMKGGVFGGRVFALSASNVPSLLEKGFHAESARLPRGAVASSCCAFCRQVLVRCLVARQRGLGLWPSQVVQISMTVQGPQMPALEAFAPTPRSLVRVPIWLSVVFLECFTKFKAPSSLPSSPLRLEGRALQHLRRRCRDQQRCNAVGCLDFGPAHPPRRAGTAFAAPETLDVRHWFCLSKAADRPLAHQDRLCAKQSKPGRIISFPIA